MKQLFCPFCVQFVVTYGILYNYHSYHYHNDDFNKKNCYEVSSQSSLEIFHDI